MTSRQILAAAALTTASLLSSTAFANTTMGGPRNIGVPVKPAAESCAAFAATGERVAMNEEGVRDGLFAKDRLCRTPALKTRIGGPRA